MRNEINIKSLLDAVTVPADWVGIREVYESNTPRMIRDGVPVSNGHYATHGAMIEVLVNGQFGYYGTPDLTKMPSLIRYSLSALSRPSSNAYEANSEDTVGSNVTFINLEPY